MSLQSVNILGVQVMAVDQSRLVEQVFTWIQDDAHRTVTYVNTHCLNMALRLPRYRQQLMATDLVYVDGIGVVWAGRIQGCKDLHKVTGRNWIEALCQRGEEQNLRLYLLGGKPGVADQARQALCQRYPRLHICGVADGFFQSKSEEEVLTEINASQPQVLLVGMGAPIQEQWVAESRSRINANVCWSVGALFDYLAGLEKPVPGWLEQIGLEWAWRLKEDPKGKWRRYCIGIPYFIARMIWQWAIRRVKHE